MKVKLIGIGAAGNKSAAHAVDKGVISKESIMLINSTLRDIPANYRSMGIQFSNTVGGCGKERDLSKNLCLGSIKDGTLSQLDSFIDPEDELCVITSSSEGGTGSGSASVIARYLKQVIGIDVQCFVFTGFEEDGRGLQNTIEYFQDIKDEYSVQAISNKKFLQGTNNTLKAEQAANDEFVRRLDVLIGNNIIDSDQNTDETDLFKAGTNPGFMTIGTLSLEKIKNVEQFNKAVTECIDNDKSLDITVKSASRLAIFINADDETLEFIDHGFTAIKDKLGYPYEVFKSIQYDPEQPKYLSFIASGMQMPIGEVKEIYERYKEQSKRVNKEKDSFFDFASELKGNSEDSMFNVGGRKRNVIDKNNFLDNFDTELGNELTPRISLNNKPDPNNEVKFKETKVKVSKEDFMKEKF